MLAKDLFIALNYSNQHSNAISGVPGQSEETVMQATAKYCEAELIRHGVRVKNIWYDGRADGDLDEIEHLNQAIIEINKLVPMPNLFVSGHIDSIGSAGVDGILGLVYDQAAANNWGIQLCKDVASELGWPYKSCWWAVGTGAIARKVNQLMMTKMPSIIIEHSEMGTVKEGQMVYANIQRMGLADAHAILKRFGVAIMPSNAPVIPPTTVDNHPSVSGLFVGSNGQMNWSAPATRQALDIVMQRHIDRDHGGVKGTGKFTV
jgi:hypothetical protein